MGGSHARSRRASSPSETLRRSLLIMARLILLDSGPLGMTLPAKRRLPASSPLPTRTGTIDMAGIPTENIVDDLKDLRESHRQLAGEVHELRGELAGFRVEMARDLGAVRTEMATINGTLKRLEGRLDH